MIRSETFSQAVYQAICRASTVAPADVFAAFERGLKSEEGLAQQALARTYDNICYAREQDRLACSDTGWPLFYLKIGEEAKLEGGLAQIEDICREMVIKATDDAHLRPTVKHPLTGFDTNNNVGENVPAFTYKFVKGDGFEITFVAKGGGSECFGGTRYRMVAFADGTAGVEKFILDSYIDGCRSGKICPPAIIGVGIGGTADISAKLAKQASSLRLVGSRHSEPLIAEMEERLYRGINNLGIGAFGLGGTVSAFAVNIEYAFSHIGGIAVSMAASCCVTRRATMVVDSANKISEKADPQWFQGR